MKHFDIRVTGLVQGVFFRASTQRAAEELGVSGTVRNEPDGSVFIEVEGPDDALERFVAWCRRGPSRARVERVAVSEGKLRGYAGFAVTD
ncbi:MAG: acylphosphatase [bacterium]